MMDREISRRTLIGSSALLALFALPGCATSIGSLNLAEAIRRLLTISSQRAFALLMEPNGFYDSQIAQIAVPPQLGGPGASNIILRSLGSTLIRDRLHRQINRAAEVGAARAAPVVSDAIRGVSIADALGVIRGGPTAATDLLQNAMGDALFTAMVPGVGQGLNQFDNAIVTQALRLATGIDIAGLRDEVSRKGAQAIYRAIGAEEAAIRANPGSAKDPLLLAVLGVL